MYHTSPNEIKAGTINRKGIAGDCLFFSDRVYSMSESSTFVYEAEFNCVDASNLDDESIVAEISDYFDCDLELAASLLDASENEWGQDFECDGDKSWWLQGKRGECAVKMGFDGCEDTDEQGAVYIIPMFGRELELINATTI